MPGQRINENWKKSAWCSCLRYISVIYLHAKQRHLQANPHMTIDTSGNWWKGTSPRDIAEYLEALFEESYPIHEHRLSICGCGSEIFMLHWLPNEGAVRRTCAHCREQRFVCDSEENWEGRPKKFKCVECKHDQANVGTAFSLNEDKRAVRWIYVGVRCGKCGCLGSIADWKIGYEPSLDLLSRA